MNKDLQLDFPVIRALDLDGTYIQRFVEYYLDEDEAKYLLSHMMNSATQSAQSAALLYGMSRNLFLLSALVLMYKISPDREIVYSAGPLLKKLVRALWDSQYRQFASDEILF